MGLHKKNSAHQESLCLKERLCLIRGRAPQVDLICLVDEIEKKKSDNIAIVLTKKSIVVCSLVDKGARLYHITRRDRLWCLAMKAENKEENKKV